MKKSSENPKTKKTPTKENSTRSFGNFGEKLALEYLTKEGYKHLKSNFYFGRYGEIDLVVEKNDTLVFVEVKIKRTQQFGSPHYWITPAKQAKLRRAAEGFIYVNKISDKSFRFDAILIDFDFDPPKIEHIENAF